MQNPIPFTSPLLIRFSIAKLLSWLKDYRGASSLVLLCYRNLCDNFVNGCRKMEKPLMNEGASGENQKGNAQWRPIHRTLQLVVHETFLFTTPLQRREGACHSIRIFRMQGLIILRWISEARPSIELSPRYFLISFWFVSGDASLDSLD